jgi:hypothetical protein
MTAHANAPPGWDYNPSSWSQRLPIIVVGLIGFGIAQYLALYQWQMIDTVWEPFFGDGSEQILNSWVSRLLPVSDAFLGALSYLFDSVTGAIGGTKRWRTMPWVVLLMGIAVGPLGAVSILLVVLQPVLFDSWCSLCLASAVCSVAMIGPAMDEALASLQELKRARHQGRSIWRTFWGLQSSSTASLVHGV